MAEMRFVLASEGVRPCPVKDKKSMLLSATLNLSEQRALSRVNGRVGPCRRAGKGMIRVQG
jgi:hypothetical protein